MSSLRKGENEIENMPRTAFIEISDMLTAWSSGPDKAPGALKSVQSWFN